MVSCVIINYNGEKFLKACLNSVFALSYGKKEVIFMDNASTDDSLQYVSRNFPDARLISNKENLGYAGAANQALEFSSGEFVMLLNPDVVFEPDYLEILIKRFQEDRKIAAACGKILKYDFEHGKKTDIIDSTGLVMLRNRRCIDRGQGEKDKGEYNKAEEVFGITGACPLYRKSALMEAKIAGECFDGDFFAYKEDVDISWRLRLFGWKCFYEPAARAYHGRSTGVLARASAFEIAEGRKNLSRAQKYYSYKNEYLMRVKNDSWKLALRDFFPILWREFLKFSWMLLKERFLLRAFLQFLRQLPAALLKRREIAARAKISAEEIGKWYRS